MNTTNSPKGDQKPTSSVVYCDVMSNQMIEVASIDTHCMRDFLYYYVQSKIHSEIRNQTTKRILVQGCYARKPPVKITDSEKLDKPFNGYRPTTTVENDTLILNCFPGKDYVKHYASLVHTYLSITGRNSPIVEYRIPTEEECMKPLVDSNLGRMGRVEIAIIGYVQHLAHSIGGMWEEEEEGEGEGENDDKMFSWQKFKSRDGRSAVLLGCKPSFWGDTAGRLVRMLSRVNGVKCVIYIGKLGSLQPGDIPNELLATGNCSYLDNKLIWWKNVLQRDLCSSSLVAEGKVVTVQTPLCESLTWLEEWKPKCRWVDCEVGHIAEACNEGDMEFGYLHIVSDNLTKPHPYNMSNERLEAVTSNRGKLFQEVQLILKSFFDH